MAASMTVEEESGFLSGNLHSHNGYYAGDFGTTTGPTEWGHA